MPRPQLRQGILALGLAALYAHSAQAQITLSYGSLNTNNGSEGTLSGPSSNSSRSYIELGYDFPISQSLTLTPSFGVLNQQQSPVTTITDPSGYTFGLWGQYDLLAYSTGHAYAQGGLTYLDYETGNLNSTVNESELQFALGVGADLEIGENVSAFTSFNYIFSGDSSSELLKLNSPETGLEIGIEIAF